MRIGYEIFQIKLLAIYLKFSHRYCILFEPATRFSSLDIHLIIAYLFSNSMCFPRANEGAAENLDTDYSEFFRNKINSHSRALTRSSFSRTDIIFYLANLRRVKYNRDVTKPHLQYYVLSFFFIEANPKNRELRRLFKNRERKRMSCLPRQWSASN